MKLLSFFRRFWLERKTLGDSTVEQELMQFLPAALEIQNKPPHPLARKVSYAIVVFLLLALVWSYLGQVNIVASAEGKVIPTSRVKKVQPLSKGVIRKILVHEGSYVEKGQVLVELDNTLVQADTAKLLSELNALKITKLISETILESMKAGKVGSLAMPNLRQLGNNSVEGNIDNSELLLEQRWQSHLSRYQAIEALITRSEAELNFTLSTIKKYQKTIPLVQKKVEIAESLLSKGYIAEMDYLELKLQHVQLMQDLESEQQRKEQNIASINENTLKLNSYIAETHTTYLAEVNDLELQIEALSQELTKTSSLTQQQILRAPVTGFVQQLNISTVGGVVTDAQEIMQIVPKEELFEVQAFLANKDIGFVEKGMSTEIKVHTYPFTKYGVLNGVVKHISSDAIVSEQGELIYEVQVSIAQTNAEKNNIPLLSGMAVTAEVQTGKRRIIEFFMAPLLRLKQQSLSER